MSISRRSLAGQAWNKFRALWKGRQRKSARRAARSAFLIETLESRVLMAGDLASALLPPDFYAPVNATQSALSASSPFAGGEGELAEGEDAPDLVAFAKALTAAGANFYGAAWNADTTTQKALFEDGAQFLPFVEATNPDRSFNPIATGNNITTLPTWVFAIRPV